jgi:hypothetical protein
MVGWRGIALAGVLAVLGGSVWLAGDAAAEQPAGERTVKVKVELPPGVKASDIVIETGDQPYPSRHSLGDDGTVEFKVYEKNPIITIKGPNIQVTTTTWVPAGGTVQLDFAADALPSYDAFYFPDRVYDKGKAAKAAGNTAEATAAAADLDRAAKAHERYAADYEAAFPEILREVLSGLPDSFVNDFLRDLRAATTPDAKQQVVKRYAEGGTLKLPDAVTSPEYRASRDQFLKLTKYDFSKDWNVEQRNQAAQDRAWSADLRGGPPAPPGHGFVPLAPGARPQFPGQVIPGVPAAPVEYVRFDRRDFWLQLGAGAAFFDAKPVGYGTLITGAAGTEDYLAETGSRSTGYRLALDGGWDICEGGALVGHAAYRHAFYDGNGFVPIGGQDVGVTYFGNAPNGSTGINLGATGANTTVKGDFAKYEADFTYRIDLSRRWGLGAEAPRYNAGLGIGYRRFDLSYKARQTSPTFADISSKAWIDSTTNIIGPRIEGGLSWEPQTFAPVRIEIQSYVIPGFRWGDGRAKQKSLCGACGADEQNLKIVREENGSGFGLVAGFTGRVSINLTDDLALGLEGGYEFTNAVSTWHIPKGPFEAPANLAPESVKIGFVGVNLRLNF